MVYEAYIVACPDRLLVRHACLLFRRNTNIPTARKLKNIYICHAEKNNIFGVLELFSTTKAEMIPIKPDAGNAAVGI